MERVVTPPKASRSVTRILAIYGGLALLSLFYQFLGGRFRNWWGGYDLFELAFAPVYWAYVAAIALILDLGIRQRLSAQENRAYYLLWLAPALIRIGQDFILVKQLPLALLYPLLSLFQVALLLFGVGLLWRAYRSQATGATGAVTKTAGAEQSKHLESTADPLFMLGRGNGYVDRVIRSVLGRSAKAERAASFSLGVMLILVLVGGMASFGLWVFTHADQISTIEAERKKLLDLASEMEGLRNSSDQEVKNRADRLLDFVKQNYSNSTTLEGTLSRLTTQSQTNVADIAIRVTIAVLTIFLVQVFFSVYKYNRHLGSLLAAKAEALELAANDEDARRELSHEAIAVVKESVPGFGPQPRTVYEQAIGVAEKFAKR